MNQPRPTVIQSGQLNLDILNDLNRKPDLFEPGEKAFWTDPHIAGRMLAAHLDPDLDAASRTPATIDATVEWLMTYLDLQTGARVLDLGCGPGLYCSRLAARGLDVTGIDYSANSVEYARRTAAEQGQAITYHCQDYLELNETGTFDVVLLIYGDFCVLSDDDRDELRRRIHRALKPGGHFVFDVTTPSARESLGSGRDWTVSDGGFWRPGPHLVLEEMFDYPKASTAVRQVAVIEEGGELAVYRLWFHYYAPDTIRPLLERHQFAVTDLYSDLAGTPYRPDSQWLGIVAQKPQ